MSVQDSPKLSSTSSTSPTPKLGSHMLNYSLWDGAMDDRDEQQTPRVIDQSLSWEETLSRKREMCDDRVYELFNEEIDDLDLTQKEKCVLSIMHLNEKCNFHDSAFLNSKYMRRVLHCSQVDWFTRMKYVDFNYRSFVISHETRSIKMFFDEPINENRKQSPIVMKEEFDVNGGCLFKHPIYNTWCYIANTKFECGCSTCDGATESSITVYEEPTLSKLLKLHFTEYEFNDMIW
jgi:hypothetical protein